MRYAAPRRDEVDVLVWTRPPLVDFLDEFPWLRDGAWPELGFLNELMARRIHTQTGKPLRFVAQTPELLCDGLHYEQRSFTHGQISTREANWHDLLNAAIWLRHTEIKSALNSRYVAELRVGNNKQRSRAQMAITHFDEGGAIVILQDQRLISLWDKHDWHGLFFRERNAWFDGGIDVMVVGHALLEHSLKSQQLVVAKCLAVLAPPKRKPNDLKAMIAEKIARGEILNDPQELRALPFPGIPGWFAGNDMEKFYFEQACFRPLREGRVYPPPLC